MISTEAVISEQTLQDVMVKVRGVNVWYGYVGGYKAEAEGR